MLICALNKSLDVEKSSKQNSYILRHVGLTKCVKSLKSPQSGFALCYNLR